LGQAVDGQAVLPGQVLPDVGAFALHEVAGQQSAAGVGVQVRVGQLRLDQPEQDAEGRLLAAVRGGGHQQQVAALVRGDLLQQIVAELVLAAAGPGGLDGGDAGVRLVHDDQVRAVPDEVVTVPGGLDEVGGDND